MVGAFVGLGFRDADRHDAEMAKAMEIARRLHADGRQVLIAAEAGDDRRRGEAGHVEESSGLTDEQWRNLATGLHDLADNLEPLGMSVVFHNHVGTYVETPGETARLLDETDPAKVGWCLDIGHLAYGGGNSLEMLGTYGDRVRHIHLKDVSGEVLAQAQAESWSFGQALKSFIFPALGEGIAQVPECVAAPPGARLRRLVRPGAGHDAGRSQGCGTRQPGVPGNAARQPRTGLMGEARAPGTSPGPGPHADLEALARRGRLLVIETVAHSGAGHVGGPLSAMDLLVALYFRVLRIRPGGARLARARPVHPVQGPLSIGAVRGHGPARLLPGRGAARPSTRPAPASRATRT